MPSDDFAVELYANFGTEEPFVARIALGLYDIVFAVPAFAATRDAFNERNIATYQTLGMAFEDLRLLNAKLAENAPALRSRPPMRRCTAASGRRIRIGSRQS